LTLPLGIQAIINLIQGGDVSTSWIVLVSLVIFGITVSGFLQLMQLRIVENLSQRIFTRASFEFAYRIPRINYKALYKYYAPELANRFFDTLTIQKGLPKLLIDFSLAAFQIVVGLIVLSLYHPFFILFGVALIALIYTIFAITGPKGIKTSLKESKHKYSVAFWLEEVARAKMSFKLATQSDITLDQINEKVVSYLKARESHFSVLVTQFKQLIGFKVLIAAGLLIIGGLLVFRQEMNIGQFVAAEIIILLIISSVEKLIQSLDSIYDVLTALEKIGYVTDMELEKEEGFEFELENNGIRIDLTDVHYAFPDENINVLQGLNLQLKANESYYINGANGSGKSTLMHLISGVLEPTKGVIKYNDLSMPSMNVNSIRSQIGFALNNNQVFLGSIYDNIVMGRKGISIQDVLKAMETVQLKSFLATLPQGLQTVLDPEGRRLPRSIVNKIILARAIVTMPKLLLLEDAMEHIKSHEKEEIIKRLIHPANPWSIIVTSVDTKWQQYIPNEIILANGNLSSLKN